MNEWLWYVGRATGVVTLVIMTSVLVLGIVLSSRSGRSRTSAISMGVHRNLSLGMLIFLTSHIATACAETYVSIDWISALVPFTSSYERFAIGLGTLAVDLGIAVLGTSLLRHMLSRRAWRWVHLTAYALWPMCIVHGVMMATDDQPLLTACTYACAVVGALAVAARFAVRSPDRTRRRQVLSQEWS